MAGVLKKVLVSGFEKELMSAGLLQCVLCAYVTHCSSPRKLEEMAELLTPSVMQLQNVKEGVSALVGLVNASMKFKNKTRKALLRALGEFSVTMACDASSVLLILRILEVYDDTVLLSKYVLRVLLRSKEVLLCHERACLVLLLLCAPRSERYFARNNLYTALCGTEPVVGVECKKAWAEKRLRLLSVVLPEMLKYCATLQMC